MICDYMSASVIKHPSVGRALFWSSALSEPLFTLYAMITLILYKDLGASAWQIALLTMLKPLVSILSFYWSAGLGRSGKIKSNVLWAGFFMRAPFLFCPWFDSVWFVIGAAVNYMFFHRAVIPGWMELVKRNTDTGKLGKLFSLSSAFGYAEGVVLSLAMGCVLDHDPGLWKILFFITALIGMGVLIIQVKIPVEEKKLTPKQFQELAVGLHESGSCIPKQSPLRFSGVLTLLHTKLSRICDIKWGELLLRPWKDSYRLIRERPDFARYQWGFMVCGFGIMLIQPALPIFAVDELGVSHTMAAGGISIAKGLGFSLSSLIWARWIQKVNILRLASWVFLSVALFPVLMACSLHWIGWFYLAYFWYGIGQGGSHLVWHMGGPIFAGKEESSRYSGVGLMMVGLRGAVAPPIGGWIAMALGPIAALLLGGLLSFYSGARLLRSRFAKKIEISQKV